MKYQTIFFLFFVLLFSSLTLADFTYNNPSLPTLQPDTSTTTTTVINATVTESNVTETTVLDWGFIYLANITQSFIQSLGFYTDAEIDAFGFIDTETDPIFIDANSTLIHTNKINITQFFYDGLLQLNMTWLNTLFYTKDEVNSTIDTKILEFNSTLDLGGGDSLWTNVSDTATFEGQINVTSDTTYMYYETDGTLMIGKVVT